jgi:hypothetical protein
VLLIVNMTGEVSLEGVEEKRLERLLPNDGSKKVSFL